MLTTVAASRLRTTLLVYACLALPGSAYAGSYWVSPDGQANWSSCRSDAPLNGTAACSISTANTNAAAGDTVYFRGGTYTVSGNNSTAISPANSGACSSRPCLGGVGASRIVFSAYAGETPIIAQGSVSDYSAGIMLNGKSWIKVSGITFKNFKWYLAFIYNGASYNEVSHCQFIADVGREAGNGFIVGAEGTIPATNNWIHHNAFSRQKNSNGPCNEGVDMIRIGTSASNPWSADDNNSIEYNYVEYAAHSTLTTNSLYNVIANNTFHNEPWIAGCTSWDGSTSNLYGNVVGSTSATSAAIGTGTKTFTVATGLSSAAGWATNYPVSIVRSGDYSQVMSGTVLSYSSANGALVVNVQHTTGSGTYTSWVVSLGQIPYYTNSAYNGLYSHRNIALGDENHYVDNRNLAEGNRLGFAGLNPNNDGDNNLTFESPGNIGRYNVVFGGMGSGIYFKWANTSSWGDHTGGVRNHVYNNSVYHNGYGWNAALYGGSNQSYNGQGIGQLDYSATVSSDNVIKNNLVYDNGQGDICEIGWRDNANCTPATYDTVVSNWVTSSGDPRFSNPDLNDPTSQNLFSAVHGYRATPIPDLSLQASSPAIDGGTYLTQAKGAGTNSTTLVVDDAAYFQDGTWGSDLARGVTFFADRIAIGTVTNTVEIRALNYATNTITLASPVTWSDRAPVWLYRKSDGAVVLVGSAPDFGASEFGAATPRPPAAVQIKR